MIPKDDGGKVFLFECYKDDSAFAEHNKSPLLAATREQYRDMLEDRKITITEVVS
jgi:quinol monooxygenase YgiN